MQGSLAEKTLANSVAPPDATAKNVTLARLPTSYDGKQFLTPGSDQVALLVLAHQTQMHNLITLTNYRTRIALHDLSRANPEGAAPAGELTQENARQVRAPGRAAAAIPAVRQRGTVYPRATRSRPSSSRHSRASSRRAGRGMRRAVRCATSTCTRARSDIRAAISSMRTRSMPCRNRPDFRLPPPAAGPDGPGQQRRFRCAIGCRPAGGSGNPAGDQARLPQEWHEYARQHDLRVARGS